MPDERSPLIKLLSLLVRVVLSILAELETASRRLLQMVLRPRFRIAGRCQSNGLCCKHVLIVEDGVMTRPGLRALGMFWLCRIYRFRPSDNAIELPDGRMAWLYTCDAFGTDQRCHMHLLRPAMCRRYPMPGYFVAPSLHPGCGYRVVDSKAGSLDSV